MQFDLVTASLLVLPPVVCQLTDIAIKINYWNHGKCCLCFTLFSEETPSIRIPKMYTVHMIFLNLIMLAAWWAEELKNVVLFMFTFNYFFLFVAVVDECWGLIYVFFIMYRSCQQTVTVQVHTVIRILYSGLQRPLETNVTTHCCFNELTACAGRGASAHKLSFEHTRLSHTYER